MGKTVLNEGTQPLVYLQEGGKMRPDGAQHKQVYGCYMHGLFDMSETVRAFLTAILKQKGIDPSEVKVQDRKAYKEEQYEQLAAIVRENLQMETVYRIIEKGNEATCSLSFE